MSVRRQVLLLAALAALAPAASADARQRAVPDEVFRQARAGMQHLAAAGRLQPDCCVRYRVRLRVRRSSCSRVLGGWRCVVRVRITRPYDGRRNVCGADVHVTRRGYRFNRFGYCRDGAAVLTDDLYGRG